MAGGISHKIEGFMEAGSWIRKMFEEGASLKKQFGDGNVFDFSLGNPMGEPPRRFKEALIQILENPVAGGHGYMPNAGYPDVRAKLAEYLSSDHGVPLGAENVIMTVGAAGALNVTLKSLINPGETVLIFAPYFVEYRFYIDNVGGKDRVVETDDRFDLDLDAIRKAMDPSVKAMIINTPNNPTGRVYSEASLMALSQLVEEKSEEYGHPIYILSDEPYKRIIYDDISVPSLLKLSRYSIVCTSFSKELCIPGERLGYIAVNPDCPDIDTLTNALTFCNRILGFVNAPALMQRALGQSIGIVTDISQYVENRSIFMDALLGMGYDIIPPEGAFYLFPKSPIENEVVFTDELKKEKILAVPGRGFGRAGYFRLSYCVTPEIIRKALPGFKRVFDRMTG